MTHRSSTRRFYGLAAVLAFSFGCAGADWEEHHRLALDGSGESSVRVAPALVVGLPALRAVLSARGVVVEEVRPESDGRILARVSFRSVADLCGAPLFGRECAYRRTDDGFELVMEIPPGWPLEHSPGASAAIRIRSEGRVTGHNADGPLERGNVLVWTRSLDRLAREGLEIRIRTGRTSVLGTTVRTVVRSTLIALGILAAFLLLVIAEGKRRLARQDAGPGGGSVRRTGASS